MTPFQQFTNNRSMTYILPQTKQQLRMKHGLTTITPFNEGRKNLHFFLFGEEKDGAYTSPLCKRNLRMGRKLKSHLARINNAINLEVSHGRAWQSITRKILWLSLYTGHSFRIFQCLIQRDWVRRVNRLEIVTNLSHSHVADSYKTYRYQES